MMFFMKDKGRFIVERKSCGYISSVDKDYRGSGIRDRFVIIDTEGEFEVKLDRNTRHKSNSEPLDFNRDYVKDVAKDLNHDCNYDRLDCLQEGTFTIIEKEEQS